MKYIAYTKIVVQGPLGRTISFKLPEENGTTTGQELGQLDGLTYVSFPKHLEIPEQPEEISYEEIELTPEIKEALKLINPVCKCIDNQLRCKIRERYDSEDEMYLTRICVGSLMGDYEFRPGEQEEVAAYTIFVEGLRDWARDERAKIGL